MRNGTASDTVERGTPEATSPKFKAATLILFAAVVWIAYRADLAYRRWLKEQEPHPVAAVKASIERRLTGFREEHPGVPILREIARSIASGTGG